MKKKLKPSAQALSRERVYDGYFKFDQYTIELDKHEGGKMQVQRLILERGHSVAILAYDPQKDQVLLINQFSPGAFAASDAPFGNTLPAGSVWHGREPRCCRPA